MKFLKSQYNIMMSNLKPLQSARDEIKTFSLLLNDKKNSF